MARKPKTKRTSTKKVKAAAPSPSICRVYASEAFGQSWSETTDIKTMSRFGAGFDLSRECSVGTLIQLEISLAPELRAYDQDTELYRVVALVQHSSQAVTGLKTVYHISAMFVGRNFPDSYFSNPLQTYRLSNSDGDGNWKVTECSSGYKQRQYPRFSIELSIEIGLIQRNERTVIKENTVTRDIGSTGASIITTLPAAVGDKIKFGCRDLDFYAIATVVKRRNFFGIRDVLHLKFVDVRFPLERLIFSKVDGIANMTRLA